MSAKQSTATKEAKHQATAVSEFKKRKKGQALSLPSGLTVVARRVELREFLRRGDVPNALLAIVEEALDKGRKFDPGKMIDKGDGKVDLDAVNDMYETVNALVVEMMVTPKVHPVPTEDEDGEEIDPTDREAVEAAKDDELLYVDEIDDEDKMFLFQWATGGTSDVATFRAESSEGLAALAPKQKPGKSAKRPSGGKKR